MFRLLIAIVATSIAINASNACTTCKRNYSWQKQTRCHSLVDQKGMKGPAYKAEWNKCVENPDNYK
jgi:hypothetical protein